MSLRPYLLGLFYLVFFVLLPWWLWGKAEEMVKVLMQMFGG